MGALAVRGYLKMAMKNLINRLKTLEEMVNMGQRITLEYLVSASFGLVLKDINPDDPLIRAVMEVKKWEGF